MLFNIFIFSCDSPVRTRVPITASFDSSEITDPGATNGTVTGGTTTTTTTTDEENQEGFEHCPYLDPQFDGGSMGYFGLCQSDDDDRVFKAVFAETSTQGNCFVPIHILDNGNSFKLGRAECVHNQPDTNYYMTLTKEAVAPTYSFPRTEEVNGVMVLRLESVNAYMGCMNAKEDFYVATNGCCFQRTYNQSTGRYNCIQPNIQCEAAADNYANNICNSFVQNHSNNYRQVNF